ncbi:sulfatase-like hydrolase/transferase [Haloarcula sp. CGMCC 1.6347]|uniref:sulfatase-like hydrolase/transferase n=1 Tax=Haloarcula sp. CGMCC 1.6347 TaxID=3111455 RepID=UPI00300F5A5A
MDINPRKIEEKLPKFVRDRVTPFYFKYKSIEADREYTPPSRTLSQKDKAPDHILLIVVDALRPEQKLDIDLEFTTGVTAGTWTFPSVTSIATGLLPNEHGSVAHTHPNDEEYAMPKQTTSHLILPRDLDAAGYDTYAGCSFMTPFLALRGAFQTHHVYDDESAKKVLDQYRYWRSSRDQSFGYIHLGDLHAPIEPPKEYIKEYDIDMSLPGLSKIHAYKTDFDPNDEECKYYRDHKLRLYRAAADYISDQLRPLISEYKDDTAIILVGDHGESLWEHQKYDRQISDSRPNYCFGHGGTPFDKLARVPIGVSGKVPAPTGGWASLIDIAPTITNLAVDNIEYSGYNWQSQIPENRAVICEATRYGVERKAVYMGENKIIRSEADDVSLKATVSSEGESFEELSDELTTKLIQKLPTDWDNSNQKANTSTMVQQQLEALGYH